MAQPYADPERNGANAIVDGPPSSRLPASYLNDWLIGEIEGLVTRQGIELSENDLTQLEQGITALIEAYAASLEQGLAADEHDEWLSNVIAEAGLDPASDSDMLLVESIGNLITSAISTFGLGSLNVAQINNVASTSTPSGFYQARFDPASAPNYWKGGVSVIVTRSSGIHGGLYIGIDSGSSFIAHTYDGPSGYASFATERLWTSANSTPNSNGMLVTSSPRLRVYDSNIDRNEADNAAFEKIGTGHYRITGTAGVASDPWDMFAPTDTNQNPLVYLDYTVAHDGTIDLRTYQPVANGPFVAAGDPKDIPEGRWVDIHLIETTDEPA